jgi:phosphoribosylaminoimidazolecarboxamide formyltransferase/IMP cyclohydrolase
MGIKILSSGGTASALRKAGMQITDVSEFTGSPEMFGGRVKTLHPKVHGGILFRRGNKADEDEAQKNGIEPIDMVVVNLYPFEKVAADHKSSQSDIVENIDIGGPSLLRAAAKNFEHVAVVTDPEDYDSIVSELREGNGALSDKTRYSLMLKAFARTSDYDWAISRHFAKQVQEEFPEYLELRLQKAYDLRYGENPHQRALAYRQLGKISIFDSKIHSAKQMSYNNFVDANAALDLIKEFFGNTATVIIKHTNPCGGATADTLAESCEKAYRTDPLAAFGGIIAFSKRVDLETAEVIGDKFLDVIVAPGYDDDALEYLKRKEARRILDVTSLLGVVLERKKRYSWVAGGMLYQEEDGRVYSSRDAKVVSKRAPTKQELDSMFFATIFAKHAKSNAVIISNSDQLIGVGAGQMSRIDSCRIAIAKAKANKFDLRGTVASSDAFLPFRDTLDELADAGVTALCQPGGSLRDSDIIDAANERGMAMIFTGLRHFKH